MLNFKSIAVCMTASLMPDTLKDILCKNMQQSSIFHLYNSNISSIESIFSQQPFFNSGLLLFVYTEGMQQDTLKKVLYSCKENKVFKIVFFCDKFKTYEYVSSQMGEQCKQLSCYKPPKWLVIEYLNRNTTKKFSTDGFDTFYTRMRGQWKLIDNFINELEVLPTNIITSEEVKKVIPNYSNLNLDRIFVNLVNCKLTAKDFKCLYTYKYASKFILKELLNRVHLAIDLKQKYLKGKLSYKNISSFAKEEKQRDYIVKLYLDEIITQVSTSYLFKWKHIIEHYKNEKDGFMLMVLETGVLKW